MNVKDITALLAKGYKPADIKSVGDMAKENREIIELAKSTTSLEELKTLAELVGEDTAGESDSPPESKDSNADNNSERDESDPTPNYKELLEKSQKEVEELKKKVEKMQGDNTRKDNSGNAAKQSDALADFAKAVFN